MRALALLAVLTVATTAFAPRAPATEKHETPRSKTALVGPGAYQPPSPAGAQPIPVARFELDRDLVTNADFLAFVRTHSEWRRDRIARVFADEGYLAKWESADSLGNALDVQQPVVEVSWFSARAYCGARNMRLATTAEWEVAAAASPTRADGKTDPAWQRHVLELYSAPAQARLPRIGGETNFWGIRDMHAVVWEWVLDFSSTAPVDCGAVAGAGNGAADFPTFERAAMRTALHGDTTTPNLGFRCARDLPVRGEK